MAMVPLQIGRCRFISKRDRLILQRLINSCHQVARQAFIRPNNLLLTALENTKHVIDYYFKLSIFTLDAFIKSTLDISSMPD